MYDTIIIGLGPAGLTAAIYAARREMKVLIIGKELGGQLVWASEIENYPGFKSINSFELIEKMKDQVVNLRVEINNNEVKGIIKLENGGFILKTEKQEYKAMTIIIAMGLSPRRLAIPGEQELTGKGVSYCANCDGPFYKEKIVAVVGGGNSALDAAELLSKIAKKVYLIHRRDEFRGFEALVEEVKKRDNIEMEICCELQEIIGKEKVEKIRLINNQINEMKEIVVDGVFIEIGRIAHTDLISNLVKRDEKNQIVINEKCQTSTEGIFAAGDVTTVPFKQITIGTGQGTIAALAAYEYLQLKQGKEIGKFFDRGRKQ
ncbi:MAG: thioredoxin-disulfide reductase, partial [Patescibacteria group bacterium]